MARAILPSSIEIKIELEREACGVVADPTQIRQVLMNLITNASQAMPSGSGSVAVGLTRVTLDRPLECRGTVIPPGKYVRLSVSDTGCGMDAATIERIFEPFFSTKEVGKGTGLGLAVVHGILMNHGAGVTVSSTVGQGSRFAIYFPAASGDVAGEVQSVEVHPRGSERILVVDDESLIVYMIQRMLERLGYSVVTASSVREAREKFAAQAEDLDALISDQTMPEMTGLELAAALRKIRPDLPVILTSGYHEAIGAANAREAGIDAYVRKPVSLQQLSSVLRRVLDTRRRERAR